MTDLSPAPVSPEVPNPKDVSRSGGLLTLGKLPSVPARALGPFGAAFHRAFAGRWWSVLGDLIGVLALFVILFGGLFLAEMMK